MDEGTPEYLRSNYLPGIHHQSWAPNDDFYQWHNNGVPRREWIGYLYETYKGVVSGMWVVPTLPLDGELPNFARVYVYNIYKWNFGKIGATIRVEEDWKNNRWIALQQEYTCPPSETVSPPTPPPVDDGTGGGEGEPPTGGVD